MRMSGAPWIRREMKRFGRSFRLRNPIRVKAQPENGCGFWRLTPSFCTLPAMVAFARKQPFFSGLLLADGWLTIPQIYQLRLKADLVTLSGCETGIHEVSGGDELLGLTRGFLYAGASSMLVSLWRVADDSTAFYHEGILFGLASVSPSGCPGKKRCCMLARAIPIPISGALPPPRQTVTQMNTHFRHR